MKRLFINWNIVNLHELVTVIVLKMQPGAARLLNMVVHVCDLQLDGLEAALDKLGTVDGDVPGGIIDTTPVLQGICHCSRSVRQIKVTFFAGFES